MDIVKVKNQTHPREPVVKARLCQSFLSKFRGLMFQKQLGILDGIILVESKETIAASAIHMFFMNFDIAVIWLNKDRVVVDKNIARRWRPYYAPSQVAQYILETHIDRWHDFNVNDQIYFESV